MKWIVSIVMFIAIIGGAQSQTWEKVAQKYGGDVQQFEVTRNGTAFCTFGNRIFRSNDGVVSWRTTKSVTDSLARVVIGVGYDSTKREILLAFVKSSSYFRSTDEGDSWEEVSAPFALGTTLENLGVFSLRYGAICVASTTDSTRVWITKDNGVTFSRLTAFKDRVTEIHQAADTTIYCATNSSLHKVNTSGVITTLSFVGALRIGSTQEFSGAPINLYVATLNQGVRKSSNGGQSFISVNNSPQNQSITGMHSNRDGDLFLYTLNDSSHVYKLSSGASSFQKVFSSATLKLHDAKVLLTGVIASPGANGILVNEDGTATSWTPYTQGLTAKPLSWVMREAGISFAASYPLNVIERTTDAGLLWSTPDLPINSTNGIVIAQATLTSGNTMLLPTKNGAMYSTDFGVSWYACKQGNSDVVLGSFVEISMSNLISGYGTKYYSSTDDGKTWTVVAQSDGDAEIRTMCRRIGNGNAIVATSKGIYSVNPQSFQGVKMLDGDFYYAVNNFKGDVGVVGKGLPSAIVMGRMLKNDNSFTTFSKSNAQFDSPSESAAISPEGDLYFGAYESSAVLGVNSTSIQDIKFSDDVLLSFYQARNGDIVAGGAFGGVWVLKSSSVSVENEESKNEISVYPNPVSGLLKVSSFGAEVLSLSVINSLGQVVAESTTNALNTNEISSGVYTLVCTTENGVVSKQIVITH